MDFNRRSTNEKSQEVHKMADFTKDAAAPLVAVLHPMIARNHARVDPIVQCQWFTDFIHERSSSAGHGRKAAIEADHQQRLFDAARIGIDDFGEFAFCKAKWLFAEDMLAGSQR